MAGNTQTRRATLADVPAVARLLLPSRPPSVGGVVLSPEASAGVLRLALTHIGLDAGSIWLREQGTAIVSAVALLPPHGAVDDQALLLALRLELGLGEDVRRPGMGDSVPDQHWLLLVPEGHGQELELLASRALVVAADSALAVVCPAAGEPETLVSLGFVARPDGLLVRPALWAADLATASV